MNVGYNDYSLFTFKKGIAYMDFGCNNCIDFRRIVEARKQSILPIDENKLEFCKRCVRMFP